jgi:hypothetical protein
MGVSRIVHIVFSIWLLSTASVLSSPPSLSESLSVSSEDAWQMQPVNVGLQDAPLTDQGDSMTSFGEDTSDSTSLSSVYSSSPETSVEIVEFWPFHKKNKTANSDDNNNNTKHNKTRDETCAAQHDCSACAVHSHMCHWCAHDNACHSIGSIYGCISGVNCFSNDRCKRQDPDPIPDIRKYSRMGVVPMVIALALTGVAFCCASFGFCLACGIKGAYDDLAEIAAIESRPFVIPIHALTTVDTMQQHTTATTTDQDDEAQDQEDGQNGDAANRSDAHYIRMNEDAERSPLLLSATPPKDRRIPRHMQRCFNACTLCYVVTVAIIGSIVYGTVHYYPKIPMYSVCSDQVAWQSLIDSIAAVKVDASFEILISVANPNYEDAVLDMGKGTFKHNNAFVGTFEIPPANAKAMSISDLMIIARGKLILHIDTKASIRIPSVFNYTYEVDVKDMIVNVNEKDDRSLCKCPTWDEIRNTTKPRLSLELPSVLTTVEK